MRKLILPLLSLFIAATMFAQTAGTLTVTFTTKASPSAAYGTKNLVALWIGTSSNAFVKTVIGATGGNTSDLTNWKSLAARNVVNAVTSATRSNYGTITGTWDGKNTSSVLQADADYKVNIECTDDDGTPTGGYQTYTFTKGPSAVTLTTPNVGNFTNISISWAPANTAINNVEMDKYYTLYPNPAASYVYVSGLDIEGIDICNLSAKTLIMSNEQKVNISSLPKGAYLAVVYTKKGTVVKKFQKM